MNPNDEPVSASASPPSSPSRRGGQGEGYPLRLAVLANFDSPHAWRWLRIFVERGHDVHAISYYTPSRELPGVRLHVLAPGASSEAVGAVREPPFLGTSSLGAVVSHLPPSAVRLLNAGRFLRAGLRRVLADIRPDVFHAHYVVEHGFFGALAAFHPYVVSAWGSDLFQAPRTPAGRLIATRALAAADLVTANDPALAGEAVRLGAPATKVDVVRLGLDREFFESGLPSINLASPTDELVVFSDRALEPLYNLDVVISAFARARQALPTARLVVAGAGSERARLESLASRSGLGDSATFVGHLDPPALRATLAAAHVYVSVPTSDSLSLSTMEAMAAGAFPVVSDLLSQDWIEHRRTGLRVRSGSVDALTEALREALTDADLRSAAIAPNRARIEAEGDLETNMLAMERLYYRVASRGDSGGL